jgi:hypothetical protein
MRFLITLILDASSAKTYLGRDVLGLDHQEFTLLVTEAELMLSQIFEPVRVITQDWEAYFA